MARRILTRFRARCEPQGSAYFEVRVCTDVTSMYAEYDRIKCMPDDSAYDFAAVTVPWQRLIISKEGSETRHDECGCILFHEQSVSVDVVSHEMTHAALSYLEEVHDADWTALKSDYLLEERLCLVQGWLVGEFWWKWQRFQERVAHVSAPTGR